MIRAEIPQDVTEYKEQFFFGMTTRQLICVVLMLVLAVVTFVLLNIGQLVKKHTKLVSICLIIFAISIPFSRMYVGVHYPGDVLIGGIFGLASAFVESEKSRMKSKRKR